MFINGTYVQQWHEEQAKKIVMLHGFTGATTTWQHVAQQLPDYHIIAIDLMGHGQSPAPTQVEAYAMAQQLTILESVFEAMQLQSFVLIGYSMGGRIALSYSVHNPQRVSQLILESASPGLALAEARQVRIISDQALANKIEQNGVASFVQAWENIPLFATQKRLPLAVQQEVRTERLNQRALGLANSLRGIGTGVMPNLWNQLVKINCPVLLLTGGEDEKFVHIAREMKKSLKNAKHLIVDATGHAIHVENPVKFATIVKETIS